MASRLESRDTDSSMSSGPPFLREPRLPGPNSKGNVMIRNKLWHHLFLLGLVFLSALAVANWLHAQSSQASNPSGSARQLAGLRWRLVGPIRGGRTIAVAGIAGDSNVFYFGSVAGGVWKTTDGGIQWKPLFDHQPISSIG